MNRDVLIINQDCRAAQISACIAEQSGLKVCTVNDSLEGVSKLISRYLDGSMFQFVIINSGLQGRFGFDVIEFINESRIDVPMLILSGANEHELKAKLSNVSRYGVQSGTDTDSLKKAVSLLMGSAEAEEAM